MRGPGFQRGLVVGAALLLAGCGISKPAQSGGDAGGDAPDDTAPIADVRETGAFQHDLGGPDETPPLPSYPKTGLPLPDGVTPPRRLLPAAAELTGGRSISSCSHQQPASGDGHRWCSFSTLAADGKATELWVIDVTTAAAGDIAACDGSSAACIRLTGNLWTQFPLVGPGHPYAQAFDGDTLIFYADAISSPDQSHRGPIYAWRPGWTGPRQLTSDQGFACRGQDTAAVAVCVDNVIGDTVSPSSFTLRAGPIGAAGDGLLPVVGPIAPLGVSGYPDWQTSFSRAGDMLAVSSPDPTTHVQILSIIATSAIGSAAPTPIITDASSWAISNDGHRIYFHRQPADAPPDSELKELYAADFPSGAGAVKLASNVRDYQLLGNDASERGIIYLTEIDADQRRSALVFLADAAAPDQTKTWFSYRGDLEDVVISMDGRVTTWLSGGFVATAVRTDTLESCVLNSSDRAAAFVLEMLDNAGLVFWTEDATDGLYGRDAFVTTPVACDPKQRFARGMYWYAPVGDRGLVFGDELGSFDRVVAMKYAGAVNDGGQWSLKDPVRIDDGADPEFIVLDVASPLLIYVKQHSADADGTYLFGPVPF